MDVGLIWSIMPNLLAGALTTLVLVVQALLYGLILAVPLALLRVSPKPVLWAPAYAYIFFFRGTPLLVQIFLIYYGLGQFAAVRASVLWPLLREAHWCAVIALTLNTAGYTAEILRGAIQAIPAGEIEAARAAAWGAR